MKTKIKCIFPVLFLILGMPLVARATLVDSNSIIRDGIEYYIQTDKSVYDLGEDVEILFRITNLRDEQWAIHTIGPVKDISIVGRTGEISYEVWRWSWLNPSPPGPSVLYLDPDGFLEFNKIWTQFDAKGTWDRGDDTAVPPGIYWISGIIRGYGGYYSAPKRINESVAMDITIVPEPSAVAFFGFSLSILFHLRERPKRK
jgi:hypothetical protein